MEISSGASNSSGLTASRAPVNNLPLPATRFIGRMAQISAVCSLLQGSHLVSLTGAGGAGKTRLALEAANQTLAAFPDGVCFVDLAPLVDPNLVYEQVFRAVGSLFDVRITNLPALSEFLHAKRFLLLLDTCEHLLSGITEMVTSLLPDCPDLHILVTSRERLKIPGEKVFQVSMLSIPAASSGLPAARVLESEAVQLFVDRAAAVLPDFRLTDDLAEPVRRICRQLEGMPLAIELVAQWVRFLPPAQIADRLVQSIDRLTDGYPNDAGHHRTIRESVDWSYRQLSAAGKALFRRLAIFDGNFTLEAVETICPAVQVPERRQASAEDADLQPGDMLDTLVRLADRSLIEVIPHEQAWFRIISTIRPFALHLLAESGELEIIQPRYSAYYIQLCQQAARHLDETDQLAWLNRLDMEIDNLRGVLNGLIQANYPQAGLKLAVSLYPFWYLHAYLREGIQWLDRLLEMGSSGDPLQVSAFLAASHLSQEIGDIDQGIRYARSALEISQALDLGHGIAEANLLLGNLTNARGDRITGKTYIESSMCLYRNLDDEKHLGNALLYLADTRFRLGELDAAQADYQEAFNLLKKSGNSDRLSFALGGLGDIARVRGDYDSAARYLHDALENYRSSGNKMDVVFNLEAQAILALERGQPQAAARLFGATEALRETASMPLTLPYQQDYAPFIRRIRLALGESNFAEIWRFGRQMSADEAVEYGLTISSAQPQPVTSARHHSQGGPGELSQRELEVLRLIAAGLTDHQIAGQLVLSPRTVSKHLQSIYRKLDVNSRTAAARIAFEQKLL